jgi:hypothetical protein
MVRLPVLLPGSPAAHLRLMLTVHSLPKMTLSPGQRATLVLYNSPIQSTED